MLPCHEMKNITIRVEDELYRKARIKAEEQSTSISALVKGFIVRIASSESSESDFQRLEREEQELREELREKKLGLNPANNLSREELYHRDALR